MREAMHLTVYNYRKERVIKALPRIWRRYNKEAGDDVEAYRHRRLADFDKQPLQDFYLRKNNLEDILEGREILGEPRNMEF